MIDYEKLRKDLIDYFGTAIYYNQVAIMKLEEVKNADNEKLVEIADKNGFKKEKYKIKIK